ncbi:MAG: LysM peptidoglycan-binding domain-containing protein, partial [Spirochaetia bacterium]
MGEIIVQQKIRKRRKNGSLLRSLFIFFQQRYEELRLPDLKSLVNQISVAPVYMAILVTVFAVILFFSFSTASSGMTIQSDNFILPREDNIDHLLHSYMDVENDIPEELTSSAELPQGITQQLQENTYTLAPGDTLSEIAAEYGLTLDTLISYNGIRDVRRLSVGTELRIPNIDGVMYTVR